MKKKAHVEDILIKIAITDLSKMNPIETEKFKQNNQSTIVEESARILRGGQCKERSASAEARNWAT